MDRNAHLIRRAAAPGTPPGFLKHDASVAPPTMHAFVYDGGDLRESDPAGTTELPVAQPGGPVTWINVDGVKHTDTIHELGERFGLHALALEDVVNVGQRTKFEPYSDQLFIVLRMPKGPSSPATEQVSLFLGPGYLLTFQEQKGDCLDPVRKRLRSGRTRIRSSGPDYLAYAIVDAVLDAYFPLLESYGERLIAFEDRLLSGDLVPIEELYDLKRDLIAVRQAARPWRDMLTGMIRSESQLITPHTEPFLRDCYDHALQLMDLVDTYRELASSLIELYRSNVGMRTNEVMNVLTIVATIFIPITFVAGIYGMNFDPAASRWNMPELGWAYGYPAAIGLMLVVAVGMLVYFKKRGWL